MLLNDPIHFVIICTILSSFASGISSSREDHVAVLGQLADPEDPQFSSGPRDHEDSPSSKTATAHRVSRAAAPDSEEDDYEERLENERMETARKKKMAVDPPGVATSPATSDIQLPPGYNQYQIPKDPIHGGPIPVFVYVHVKKILDLDELSETIKLDMEFQVRWADFLIMQLHNRTRSSRDELVIVDNLNADDVKGRVKTLNNPYILDKIWKPNLFIENLLSVRQPLIMAKPLTIKFVPDLGWFEYITRISVKLDCEMDFHHYPADTQECAFSIRGFSYNKELLNLNWWKDGVYLDQLDLPSFDVKIQGTRRFEWQKNKDPNDVFYILQFKIQARRLLSYHLLQTYLSSTFYIIITCLCFLIPPRLVEARIGISMTTLLTLTAMFASVRESTPVVSYVKAIDIWMVGSIFFVFLTLSMFTFHIWLRNIRQEYDEMREDSQRNNYNSTQNEIEMRQLSAGSGGGNANGIPPEMKRDSVLSPRYEMDTKRANTVRQYDRIASLIESYSFAFFLSIFALYTITYWSWLLTSADYFVWNVNSTLNNLDGEDESSLS